MPEKVIDIPGLGPTAFPDSMTPDAMNAAAAKLYAEHNTKHPPVDPKHSWVDTAVDWLPAVGGAVGGIAGAMTGIPTFGLTSAPAAVAGASILGAGGEAAKQLINRARGKDAPASRMDAAKDIGLQGAIQGASEVAGLGIGAGLTKAAPWLMQKALKPAGAKMVQAVRDGVTPRVVQTMLDEGINVTAGGVAKLSNILSATNDEIAQAVANAPGVISPLKVAGRLTDTAQQFANQVNPTRDLEAISEAGSEFLNHPRFTVAKNTLTVPEAQALKQGTYQQLGKKYGEVSGAGIEAQKALARGLKEEIAAEVPGISALNAKEGSVIETLQALSKRVAQTGNKDPIGFAWVAAHPTTFLAALFDRSPAVKSMIARGMYQSAGTATKVSPQLIRAAVVALTTGGPADGPGQE